MKNAALVDDDTREVKNVGGVGVPEPHIPGSRFIYDTQCATGVLPNIGQIWNGDAPATFADAPTPDAVPTTQTDALDAADSALDQAKAAIAAARSLL